MSRWGRLGGALALLTAACAHPRPSSHAITIEAFRYQPDTVTVAVWDTLVWANHDVVPHTASAPGVGDTGPIAATGVGRWVATKKGTYPYICSFHPNMHGVVVVR